MAETIKRKDRHAVLYFSKQSSDAFKALAARIRGDHKGSAILVWSAKWRGPENLMAEAKAVIIEVGCPNAEAIRDAYLKFAQNVEIHFVESDGETFVDSLDPEEAEEVADDAPQTETDTAVQDTVEGPSDSTEADEGDGEDTPVADIDGEQVGEDEAGSDTADDQLDRSV